MASPRLPLAIAATAVLFASPVSSQAPTHPLDGLSGAEHWVARDVLVAAGRWDSTTRVAYVGLNEPPKAEVLAWRPGSPMRRWPAIPSPIRSRSITARCRC